MTDPKTPDGEINSVTVSNSIEATTPQTIDAPIPLVTGDLPSSP